MQYEEDELFRNEFSDVKPLKPANQVVLQPAKKDSQRATIRQQLAQSHSVSRIEDVPPVEPDEILSYRIAGLQHGVFSQLKQGKYSVEAELNVRMMKLDEAKREFDRFIKECRAYDIRTALIIHGKGRNSESQQSILKAYIAHWLKQVPELLAYHSAKNRKGGTGAIYALFQKSEKLKIENRLRHGGK
jgi:DNA-nicking Smr family endonuclease